MKLRNKKTGEIGDIAQTSNNAIIVYYPIVDGVAINPQHRAIYESLAELAEEWEDAPEEPKRHWIIDTMNDRVEDFDVPMVFNESIGNYFDTREEAELAVRKLKAWKRLKDKGLEVTEWSHGLCLDKTIVGRFRYEFPIDSKEDIEKDLDLLFGGEE